MPLLFVIQRQFVVRGPSRRHANSSKQQQSQLDRHCRSAWPFAVRFLFPYRLLD